MHGFNGATSNSPGESSMADFKNYVVKQMQPVLNGQESIEFNASLLERQVNELLAREPGRRQVDIVTHSMGGLVARRYAFTHPGVVGNLVMVATPNAGPTSPTSSAAAATIPGGIRSRSRIG